MPVRARPGWRNARPRQTWLAQCRSAPDLAGAMPVRARSGWRNARPRQIWLAQCPSAPDLAGAMPVRARPGWRNARPRAAIPSRPSPAPCARLMQASGGGGSRLFARPPPLSIPGTCQRQRSAAQPAQKRPGQLRAMTRKAQAPNWPPCIRNPEGLAIAPGGNTGNEVRDTIARDRERSNPRSPQPIVPMG